MELHGVPGALQRPGPSSVCSLSLVSSSVPVCRALGPRLCSRSRLCHRTLEQVGEDEAPLWARQDGGGGSGWSQGTHVSPWEQRGPRHNQGSGWELASSPGIPTHGALGSSTGHSLTFPSVTGSKLNWCQLPRQATVPDLSPTQDLPNRKCPLPCVPLLSQTPSTGTLPGAYTPPSQAANIPTQTRLAPAADLPQTPQPRHHPAGIRGRGGDGSAASARSAPAFSCFITQQATGRVPPVAPRQVRVLGEGAG